MSTNPSDNLERLISRVLDDEASAAQQRELRSTLGRDPAAQALFDDYAAIDREAGVAMRRALGRTLVFRRASHRWTVFSKFAAAAAAACLTLVVWNAPGRPSAKNGAPVQAASWFAPRAPTGDTLRPEPPTFDRPQDRRHDMQRDWILIPGDRPGEVMVIEVNRVRTRVQLKQRDF